MYFIYYYASQLLNRFLCLSPSFLYPYGDSVYERILLDRAIDACELYFHKSYVQVACVAGGFKELGQERKWATRNPSFKNRM